MAGSEKQIYEITVTDTSIQDNDWTARDRDTDKITVKAQYSDLNTYIQSKIVSTLTDGSVLFVGSSAIAQDNSNFFYDDTKNALGLGTTDVTLGLSGSPLDARLVAVTNGFNNIAHIVYKHYGDLASLGSVNYLCRGRGSESTPAIVQNDDLLASFSMSGFDGTDFHQAALVTCSVDGVPGSNDMPGRITFVTTKNDGSGNGLEAMRINSSQSIGIGTGASIDASAKVQIDSTTRGFMVPRMTTAGRNGIASPAESLEIYNTTTHQKEVYNGTSWVISA